MRVYFYSFVFFMTLLLPAWVTAQPGPALNIGDQAPSVDLEFLDTSGRTLSLNEIADDGGLMVIFSSNTCPWVAKSEDRYNAISGIASQNNIGVIALNSNQRIRERGESMEDMRRRAQKMNYSFPYGLDENHNLADAFGATQTPEVFLFNENLTLVYHGAIDDDANSLSGVDSNYLDNAINQLVNGEEISTKSTNVVGCSIKRNE
ncbi:redoxin domain-containing protein [Gracilimonas sp.]|uniref:redoxin domain-containing protein n=1 Tax=Gracilimonas sp. TaxID=1974203 RepID=UPI002870BDF1|nr:redoxin domain-containing protein [Gracilimonas sp.]